VFFFSFHVSCEYMCPPATEHLSKGDRAERHVRQGLPYSIVSDGVVVPCTVCVRREPLSFVLTALSTYALTHSLMIHSTTTEVSTCW
jgi:hypothetical protein